jgi:hypothetical protein
MGEAGPLLGLGLLLPALVQVVLLALGLGLPRLGLENRLEGLEIQLFYGLVLFWRLFLP